jgi:hypothetical protein
MDEDTYRALLGRYGAASSKDARLQPAHYREMMQVFASLGFAPAKRAATPGRAAPAQVAKITALEHALHWAENPRRLRAYLEKWYHVSDRRFLTPRQAWRAIEGLKAILAKQSSSPEAVHG